MFFFFWPNHQGMIIVRPGGETGGEDEVVDGHEGVYPRGQLTATAKMGGSSKVRLLLLSLLLKEWIHSSVLLFGFQTRFLYFSCQSTLATLKIYCIVFFYIRFYACPGWILKCSEMLMYCLWLGYGLRMCYEWVPYALPMMYSRQMEELHGENQELVRRLAGQEESLHYSSRQLEQRSADCQALNRQLEAAVADVRQQVLGG